MTPRLANSNEEHLRTAAPNQVPEKEPALNCHPITVTLSLEFSNVADSANWSARPYPPFVTDLRQASETKPESNLLKRRLNSPVRFHAVENQSPR